MSQSFGGLHELSCLSILSFLRHLQAKCGFASKRLPERVDCRLSPTEVGRPPLRKNCAYAFVKCVFRPRFHNTFSSANGASSFPAFLHTLANGASCGDFH